MNRLEQYLFLFVDYPGGSNLWLDRNVLELIAQDAALCFIRKNKNYTHITYD